MPVCTDADENEWASISRALGGFYVGWRKSADTMSHWVIESMQEIVSELKKQQRGSFSIPTSEYKFENAERDLQATSCSRKSGTGCHLQIRGRTITWHVNLDTAEREYGGLKVIPMRNGGLLMQTHCYGSVESVSIRHRILSCN